MTAGEIWKDVKENPWSTVAWILIVVLTGFLTYIMFIPLEWTWASQIMGALLGALVTIVATRLLLGKQSEIDEKQRKAKDEADKELKLVEERAKKNATIFERKLDIYQGFLETLNKVLEDGVVTPQEALTLKFKVSMVALHADGERVNEISKAVNRIFQDLSHSDGLEVDKVRLQTLFEIVRQFRIDIYEDTKTLSPDKLNETFENFAFIDEAFKVDTKKIDSAKGDITKLGWAPIKETDSLYAFKKNNIRIRITRDPKLYFSVVLDSPYEICQRDAYLNLRYKFGGAFNSGRPWGWYLYFSEDYATIADEDLAESFSDTTGNSLLNDYISRYLFNIASFIDDIIRPLLEVWVEFKDFTKWQKYMYLDEIDEVGLCLANQFNYLEIKPFIDFWISDDNKYSVVLSVRCGDDKLGAFLQSIDVEDTRADNSSRLVSNFDDPNKAINHAKQLMNIIEKKYPS